jgi:hypothetical protein
VSPGTAFFDLVFEAIEEEERGPARPPRSKPDALGGCGQDSCTCGFRPGECLCMCLACSSNVGG